MTGHTAGPWQAKSRYGWDEIVGNLDGPDDGHYTFTGICEVLDEAPIDECHANARLIAAAPDLLEALVMVRDADDDCIRDHLETMPAGPRAAIDAAIAKATGGTP